MVDMSEVVEMGDEEALECSYSYHSVVLSLRVALGLHGQTWL